MKGAGSVQVRVLLKREPEVQLTKPPHVDQVDQIDHPPSTESQMNDSRLVRCHSADGNSTGSGKAEVEGKNQKLAIQS